MDSTIISSLIHTNQQKFIQQCSPVFVEYQLMREFVLFQQQNISHVYIVPSASSTFKWFGLMFVHYGLYQGAVLRFTLVIPSNYPDCGSPKVIFDPIPYHPFVNRLTGELSVDRAFPNWKSTSNQLWEVILYAKRVFHKLETEFNGDNQVNMSLVLNVEAAKAYKNDIAAFNSKVSQTVEESLKKLDDTSKDSDANAIHFGSWNSAHEELRNKLISGSSVINDLNAEELTHPSAAGLSWVKKGTLQMFSKSGA